MADNDIYNSKGKYEHFKENLEEFLLPPKKRIKTRGNCKYYCKNPKNLEYFRVLFNKIEAKDLSYVRRNRLVADMRLITYVTKKNMKDLVREDIDEIMKFVNEVYPNSRTYFVANIKCIWKMLFPEKDERGRIDETIVSYAVRHLSRKTDKSRERLRDDRFTFEEFERLMNYFNDDIKMQTYLSLSLESLARPQELLYTKIKDVELYDNYAKIYISEHGKEGTKFLICIESFPYLIKWYNKHPFKKEKDAYLFVRYDKRDPKAQLSPKNVNERIRTALKTLNINKPVTAYSLKRNGVTFRRLRGDSDVEIQKLAGWTSTKQLRTYDMSNQEDILQIQLIKKGIIKDNSNGHNKDIVQSKNCFFCGFINKFTDDICFNCKRLLDRDKVREQEERNNEALLKLKEAIEILARNLTPETKEELKNALGK